MEQQTEGARRSHVEPGYGFEQIYARLGEAKVLGLMGPEEYSVLYGLARGVVALDPAALIVELGTYEGFSTIIVSYAVRSHGPEACQGTRIVSVDNYKEIGRTAAAQNVREFGCHDLVDLLESDATASADLFEDESIALLIVDAGHDYGDVLDTLDAFFPKVATSGLSCKGILCGHDYTARTRDGINVVRAVEEWRKKYEHRLFGWGLRESFWWTIKD